MPDAVLKVRDAFLRFSQAGSEAEGEAILAELDAQQPAIAMEVRAMLASELKAEFLDGNEDHPEQGDERESAELGLNTRTSQPGFEEPFCEGPGTILGPYKLLEQIGEGGMGTVFMAQQTQPIKRRVALKIIKPGMDTKHVIARFEAERQALALMDHPNIARALDARATDQGRPYFVMELVKGVSITEYCNREKLSTELRLQLFSDLCLGVQHAHQKGIIHRDLKPNNVLVTLHDGRPVVKIIDFGISKAIGQDLTNRTLFTQYAQLVGTPMYMSPEQAELSGLDVDTRSDIYSLGVILYELLTGTTPFDRQSLQELGLDEMRNMIRNKDPLRPSDRVSTLKAEQISTLSGKRTTDVRRLQLSLAGELDWIVMKALAKERDRRYDSALGFAKDCQSYLADEPVQACPASVGYRLGKFFRRHRVLLLTAAGVLFCLLAGMAGTSWQWALAYQAEQRAEASEKFAIGERANAEQEAEISKAINAFLTEDLLTQADPKHQANPEITLREVVDRAAKAVDTRFEDQPQVEAAIRKAIAETYIGLGKHKAAEEQHRLEYELNRQLYGERHNDTLGSRNGVARALLAQREYTSAGSIWSKLLPVYREIWGDENDKTLWIKNNLASALYKQGRYAEGEDMLQEAIRAREAHFGLEHKGTIGAYTSLVDLYLETRRYAEAEEYIRKLLQPGITTELPTQLTVRSSLARALLGLGKHAEAIEITRNNLVETKSILGSKHPTALGRLNFLGAAYLQNKQVAEAESAFEEAFNLSREILGNDHLDTIGALQNLTIARLQQGKNNSEAEAGLREVLSGMERLLGVENLNTALSRNNLANFLVTQRRLKEAEPLIAAAYDVLQKELPPDSPQVLFTQIRILELKINLGRICLRENKLELTKEKWSEAIIVGRAAVAAQPAASNAKMLLGIVLNSQGKLAFDEADYDEAIRLYTAALAVQREFAAQTANTDYVKINLCNLTYCFAHHPDVAKRDINQSRTFINEAMALDPKFPTTWQYQGLLQVRSKEWTEAIKSLSESISLQDKSDPSCQLLLAIAQYELGNAKIAKAHYQKAIETLDAQDEISDGVHRLQIQAELLQTASDRKTD